MSIQPFSVAVLVAALVLALSPLATMFTFLCALVLCLCVLIVEAAIAFS